LKSPYQREVEEILKKLDVSLGTEEDEGALSSDEGRRQLFEVKSHKESDDELEREQM
jgi:hypothetical protein